MDFLTPVTADLIVTFPVGSGNGASDCFQIEILDDDDFEGDHDFGVSINPISVSPAGITMATGGLAQITVMDNDGRLLTQIDTNTCRTPCAPLSLSLSMHHFSHIYSLPSLSSDATVTLTQSSYGGSEGASVEVCVVATLSSSSGSFQIPLTVSLSATDGKAGEGFS